MINEIHSFTFSKNSERNLKNVHPDLVMVVRKALIISKVDFKVIEGIRTQERQIELKKQGASRTLDSRHLTGHAVDLAPWIANTIPWTNWGAFELVAKAMKKAASELNIPLQWGGDWMSFRDGPHFELPRKYYP